VLCLLVSAFSASAAAEPIVSLAEDASGIGLGIVLGEPTGLSASFRPAGPSYFDAAVAWSVPEEKLHLHADYLYTIASFRDPAAPVVEFPIYLGLGPRIHLGDGQGFDTGKSSLLALRIPMGLGIRGTQAPVEGFLELVPVLGLYPATRFDFDAALGVRVYLKSRLERTRPPDEQEPEVVAP